MIKKLSQKIFWIIMFSLCTIILGIIIIFAILNYRNTINSRIFVMNRFSDIEVKRKPDEKIEEDFQINVEGVYEVIVDNSEIKQIMPSSYDEKIEEYAIKISNSEKESGIIGKYIYKVKVVRENEIHITFMEDENAVASIEKIWIFSISLGVVSIIIIYVIAKKISKTIVKPVERTFEKQKQFISDASHELKTPLAVIEANADVLSNELNGNKWLDYIQIEVESMNKLINQLLLLAKIENIDNSREYKVFDIGKTIEIMTATFESMAYEKNIILESNIMKNVMLNGNKEDIEHIISILIDNAIKHTNKDEKIIVELIKERNEIILQVKNKGEEIPEEERNKIFERFYRVDKARNRQEKRYGLGLAIAKNLVEKYKGKIEVLYKNGFTIFKVTIPVTQNK